jgi:hypothetical protein
VGEGFLFFARSLIEILYLLAFVRIAHSGLSPISGLKRGDRVIRVGGAGFLLVTNIAGTTLPKAKVSQTPAPSHHVMTTGEYE